MMLTNILKARGLGDDDKDAMQSLLKVWRGVQQRNSLKKKYYEGDITPPDIGLQIIPENVQIIEHCDWPRKAVTSVAERSRFDGFVFEGDYHDDGLEQIVATSAFKNAFNLHIPSELVHGCMFGTVGTFNGQTQTCRRIRDC